MSDPGFSVLILTYNEERNLPRCLASVRGWTDDIVVALNGTPDGSEAMNPDGLVPRVVRALKDKLPH